MLQDGKYINQTEDAAEVCISFETLMRFSSPQRVNYATLRQQGTMNLQLIR
jgi:hypothetical protein